MRAEKVIKENLPEPERTHGVLEARSAEIQTEIKTQQHTPQSRVFRRKGRNLLR